MCRDQSAKFEEQGQAHAPNSQSAVRTGPKVNRTDHPDYRWRQVASFSGTVHHILAHASVAVEVCFDLPRHESHTLKGGVIGGYLID
jgi:hypothetical protein